MTSQRKALFDVLEHHRDEALSAEQIRTLLGNSASRSAVYRNLSDLEKNGLITKAAAPESSRILYRYTGSPACKDHLHLECSACGAVYHLDAGATGRLIDNVLKDSAFMIDSTNTVLHGICNKCRKKRDRQQS